MTDYLSKLLSDPSFLREYVEESLFVDAQLLLEKAREKKGVTQSELARRLGVSKERVHEVLREPQNLTLSVLGMYAAAMGYRWMLQLREIAGPAGRVGLNADWNPTLDLSWQGSARDCLDQFGKDDELKKELAA